MAKASPVTTHVLFNSTMTPPRRNLGWRGENHNSWSRAKPHSAQAFSSSRLYVRQCHMRLHQAPR